MRLIPTFKKLKPKLASTIVKMRKLMAEWTGLEPATPGVTGRGQNPMNTPVFAILDIPKPP
jgi:hypothetical protein